MNNISNEIENDVERLQPKPSILRRLYSLSGNLCAFNHRGVVCNNLLFDLGGQFIGQVCHIEAANKKGQRFNPSMTNEERRDFENLILLCSNHHIITNDVNEYSVNVLKNMKAAHEQKFSSDLLVERMLEGLKDYSKGTSFTKVKNLNNLFKTLDPESKYQRTVEDVESECDLFNDAIEKYLNLSLQSRRVFAIGLSRAHYEYSQYKHCSDNLYVDSIEIENAMGGYSVSHQVQSSFNEILAHELMYLNDDVQIADEVYRRRLCYRVMSTRDYEIDIWLNLKKFCDIEDYDVAEFLENLNFSNLDS
ncbi:hypothetical protein U2E65_06420 [Acinetobacter baumannii]|uniref:hypothetical protein n=1 Tax=Acinetobacter baumannii TaxID=470 RepID=UPI00338F460C